MPLLSLRVRLVLPLRAEGRGPTLEPMDDRILAQLLAHERTTFVRRAQRSLPTAADAQDAVQHAMMRAAERAGSLDDPGRLRPWFGRILRRCIADFHRSQRPEESLEGVDVEAAPDPPEDPHRVCGCGTRLLDALPARYADVLRRADLQGEPTEAVASALSISTANFHVRLHRARRALRAQVMRHCGVSNCVPCLDCSCDAHGRCGVGRGNPLLRHTG
jgi:RNA polymerase sigma factor (sigma-70 family)